jgi:hypothetical protein
MSKTAAIQVALRADLATVQSGALTISDEEVALEKRGNPHAEMMECGIGTVENDPESNTIAGTCANRIVEIPIRLTLQSTAAVWTVMANLIDDVCNAVEIASSNMKAVAGMGWVVCSFESPGRAEGAADGKLIATVTVRFSYEYAQGSV